MSRRRKGQFEDQMKLLQEDISHLSSRISAPSHLKKEGPISHGKGNVSPLQQELNAAKRDLEDANFRLEQATYEIEELKDLCRDVEKYTAVIEQYQQETTSLKISLESSERIRKQQKDLIQLLQRSHTSGAGTEQSMSCDGSVGGSVIGQSAVSVGIAGGGDEESVRSNSSHLTDPMGRMSHLLARGTSMQTSHSHDGYVRDSADRLSLPIHPLLSTRLDAPPTRVPIDGKNGYPSRVYSDGPKSVTPKVSVKTSVRSTPSSQPRRKQRPLTEATNKTVSSRSMSVSSRTNKGKDNKKRKIKKTKSKGTATGRGSDSLLQGNKTSGYGSDTSYRSHSSRGGQHSSSVLQGQCEVRATRSTRPVPTTSPGLGGGAYTRLPFASHSAPTTPRSRVVKEVATTAAGTYTRSSGTGMGPRVISRPVSGQRAPPVGGAAASKTISVVTTRTRQLQ